VYERKINNIEHAVCIAMGCTGGVSPGSLIVHTMHLEHNTIKYFNNMHKHMHIYVHITYLHMYTCTYTHACMYTSHTYSVHTYIHTYIHAYISAVQYSTVHTSHSTQASFLKLW